MEHRWHPRNPVNLDVVVYLHGIPVSRSEIHNVSKNGAYIEPINQALQINQPVELEFRSQPSQHAKRYRVRAHVVHQEKTGAGLSFQTTNTSAQEAVRILFEAAKIPRR